MNQSSYQILHYFAKDQCWIVGLVVTWICSFILLKYSNIIRLVPCQDNIFKHCFKIILVPWRVLGQLFQNSWMQAIQIYWYWIKRKKLNVCPSRWQKLILLKWVLIPCWERMVLSKCFQPWSFDRKIFYLALRKVVVSKETIQFLQFSV